MLTENEDKDVKANSRFNISSLTTGIPTFLLVVGLVWNQSDWQTRTTKDIENINQKQATILQITEENGNLIKVNTARLTELETMLENSVAREDLYHWLLALKESNPTISVPIPPQS